ncbi:MAG TPA: ABC transporter permease, partial [Gemmatimonadaceae bacterium]|nr:ABC transporter permease [Gemmatimonadaceae bacterium]
MSLSLLRTLRAGIRALARKEVVARELDDELRDYVERATQEKIREGLSREAAERAVRLELGSIDATKEHVRESGWEFGVETVWQDVRYAVRGLRRNPAFTAIAVLTLALGIGANTAMFSVVNAVMLRPLPYRDPSHLVLIWTDDTRRGLHREGTAYRTITDWASENRVFYDLAFFTTQRVAPMTNDPAGGRGRARSGLVSANIFAVLGVSPLLGRPLTRADEDERAPVIVISHSFWQRWFAGAPDVIGKSLTIDDASRGEVRKLTVVGVMPAGFYFPDKITDMWTPATTYWRFTRESTERFHDWSRRWTVVARLAPHVDIANARTDLARVGRYLTTMHPSDIADFPGFGTTVLPVLDAIAGTGLQSALWLLFGATAVVLLVACVNVANLLLARGSSRQQEFAVRRALGGGRGRLLRQLAAENVVLAGAGALPAIAMATWGTRVLSTAASRYVPRIDEISVDGRVLIFAFAASLVAALLFGIVPALRLSAVDPNESLKESGRGTASLRLRKSRGLLLVAECSLAIVLLAGAGLLLRSLDRLHAVRPGFDPQNVLTMRLEFPSEGSVTAEQRTQTSRTESGRARAREQTMHDLLKRLATLPGVSGVGFIDDLFIGGQGHSSITIPGRAMVVGGELNDGSATPGLFSALRVPIVRGRDFTRDDATQKIQALWSLVATDLPLAEKERRAIPEPVVVNEAFVRRFFPNEDPIGKRFCIDPTTKTYWYVVVGVIGDMHRQGLDHEAIPEYFGPYFPSPNGRADLVVRTAGDPFASVPALRQEIARLFPSVVVASVGTADAQLGDFSAQRRLQTWLLTAFAGVALALAAVGIFGLVHYAVAERTREMGIRMALGATAVTVLALVMREGMRMPLVGIVIGLAASTGLTRVMSHLLYGITPTDATTFATVPLLFAGVAV